MKLLVEPATGAISGPHGTVHLEPRVMAVLVALARKPGELVDRHDLLAEIWPGGDIYDESLTQGIYQLRQQLGAAGGNDCRDLIRTVPKRGYLLQADIEPVVPATATSDSPPASWRRRYLLLPLAAVVLCGSLLAVLHWRGGSDGALISHPASVAVLPFLPLTEAQSDPSLEHGIADTLITQLSANREIVVPPISSVRHFASLGRDALEAGRQLGVEAVVDGSIQRSGDVLRISVRLLRVADGKALWGNTLEQNFSDIFALQDVICQRITTALQPHLGPAVGPPPPRTVGTSDTRAYSRYISGRFHLARLTPADLRTSLQAFRDAVAIDPQYAQAWIGLANVQVRLPIAGEVPPLEHFPDARDAALRALSIDPNLADGYSFLGWIAHWFDWDWSTSEANFTRAIEMDPDNAEAHLGYAHLLSNIGQHAKALEEVQRARELSPLYLTAAALEGGFLYRAGQADEAIRRLEQSVHQDPGFWLTRVTLASAYMAEGRGQDALAEARLARQASGGGTWAMAAETTVLAALGQHTQARAVLDEMLAQSRQRYMPPYDLALATLATGDLDMTMTLLQEARAVRDPKLAFLNVDRRWRPLHDRPEFQTLLKDMQFPETQE